MATPQWVRLSPVRRSIDEICNEDLCGIYEAFSFQLWVITELGILENGQFGDISRPFVECNSLNEALERSQDWMGVAITFVVKAIGSNVTLHMWRDGAETNVCLFVAAEMMWYESQDFRQGEWLLMFLLEVCSALKAECCGYGRDPEYDFVYRPLEPDTVLSLLRSGRLFQMHQPVIHLISTNVISSAELEHLLKSHEHRAGFQYRLDKANYHLLWNFRPSDTRTGSDYGGR